MYCFHLLTDGIHLNQVECYLERWRGRAMNEMSLAVSSLDVHMPVGNKSICQYIDLVFLSLSLSL
jgi:hypothetical protein